MNRPVHEDAAEWMQRIWQWADNFDIPDEEIPRDSVALQNLTYLEIYRCNFPEENRDDYPYLHYPKITYVPEEIGYLQSLHTLVLCGNELTDLPQSIKNLANLRYLKIFENCQ